MKHILAKVKGSVLAYSLILLTIVLIASIGMMSSSIVNFRSVSTSDKSGNAFQVADSGAQAVIAKIKVADPSDPIRSLFNSPSECTTGAPISLLTGEYRLSFFGGDGSETLDCNRPIADITSVKSVGTYSDTTRAVQVAVAQSGGGGITGGCHIVLPSPATIAERWGQGCKSNGSPAVSCVRAAETGFECGQSSQEGPKFFCSCVNSNS